MNRPALFAASLFSIGILFDSWINLPVWIVFLSFVVSWLLANGSLLFLKSSYRLNNIFFTIMLFWAGSFQHGLATKHLPSDHISRLRCYGKQVIVMGQIGEEPLALADRTRILLNVQQVGFDRRWFRVSGKILITFRKFSPKIDYGNTVLVKGILREPQSARNPGAFDYRKYLFRKNIRGLISVRRPDQFRFLQKGQSNIFMKTAVLSVKRAFRRSLDRNLTGVSASLMRGFVWGERKDLPESIQEAFRDTGVSHVLAVSGSNVGLIALIVFFGLRVFLLPRKIAATITIVFVVFYAFLCDLSPSVVRASIMSSTLLIGSMLERDMDVLQSLGVAALIILVFRPTDLFDVGFQLSFAATLSLVLFYRPFVSAIQKFFRIEQKQWGKFLVGTMAVSLSAQIGTAPIIASVFNSFSTVSLLANLIVVPLSGFIMASGLAACIVGLLFPTIAGAFNGLSWLLLKITTGSVRFLADLPYSTVTVGTPSLLFFLGYIFLLFFVLVSREHIWARKALLFTVLIWVNIYLWKGIVPKDHCVRVTFLDVGQGDAIFVESPNGRKILIDGGPMSEYSDAGESVIVPFLRYYKTKKIDALVLTHPHNDHIGGLIAVLENFRVDHILDSGLKDASWTNRRLWEIVRQKKIAHHIVATGDSLIGFGPATLIVLHPAPTFVSPKGIPLHGINNSSVVLKMSCYGKKFLFTGDIENKVDPWLLAWRQGIDADILKAPHHGSNTSSSPQLVTQTSPRFVVVSVGEGNKFGHPSRETLRTFEKAGARIYRTDRDGAVTFTISPHDIAVESMIN